VTPTVKSLLNWGVAQLSPVLANNAVIDTRVLLAFALGIDRGMLSARLEDDVLPQQETWFRAAIAQRVQYQPVSQIIGSREFWGRRFMVTSDVLDPRPDTETLIEEALKLGAHEKILDLGTGSGCILLTLLAEWPHAVGEAVDQSLKALEVAKANAQSLGLADRARFYQSNWFSNISGGFDLIVSNPPYITAAEMDQIAPDVRNWEPRTALTPEGDGLDAYRIIAVSALKHLSETGTLLLEIGHKQANSVLDIFHGQGFTQGQCIQDMAGKDRIMTFKGPK
jgi:release factor glutamine methyltransferase